MKRGLIVAAALVALAGTKASSQENPYTGNVIYDDCKAVATSTIGDSDAFSRGLCMGTVRTVYAFKNTFKFCVPETASVLQGVRIAVRYMENNPQELHKEFATLVALSFAQAWPCKG